MEHLKPCPACGGEARIRDGRFAVCDGIHCRVMGPSYDPDGAKWNALPRAEDFLSPALSETVNEGNLAQRIYAAILRECAAEGIAVNSVSDLFVCTPDRMTVVQGPGQIDTSYDRETGAVACISRTVYSDPEEENAPFAIKFRVNISHLPNRPF